MSSPQTEKPEIEGLILSVSDYREHDGIVHVLTDQGLESVLARGIQKESSKNRRLCLPYTKAALNYDPKYSSHMLFLINGTQKKAWSHISQDLLGSALAMLGSDLIARHGSFENASHAVETLWDGLEEKNMSKAYGALCFVLKSLLEKEGVGIQVSGCTVCGSRRHICGVSGAEGGFVCADHLDTGKAWKKENLQQLQSVVRAKDVDTWLDDYVWTQKWLEFFLEWYQRKLDYTPKSFRFWNSVKSMV